MQIYLIQNKKNKKSYVGQTTYDFNHRYDGKWWIRSHNKCLKRAAKKYGYESFDIKILWEGECSKEELNLLEGKYIKEYNCLYPNGYNFIENCESGDFINYKNLKHKNIKLIDIKNKKEIIIDNVGKFALKNNIPKSALYKVINGLSAHAYGYKLPETINEKELRYKNHGVEVSIKRFSDGEIIKIKNITKYCRDNNIPQQGFRHMLRGDLKYFFGYCLPETDLKLVKLKRKIINIKLRNNITKEIIEAKNPKELNKIYKNLSLTTLNRIIRNLRTNVLNDWTVISVTYSDNQVKIFDSVL